MALKLYTAPTTYPVTLAEAKSHCKIDTADDDALLSAIIVAATELAEAKTGRALMPQTWELTLDAFPDAFELTRTPVQSITRLDYFDASATRQLMLSTLYALDSADDFGYAYLVPAYGGEWPATLDQINAVTVRYLAGYASAAAVPEGIKQWIKLTIAAMYDNREAETYSGSGKISTVQMGFVDRLLDRYRVVG